MRNVNNESYLREAQRVSGSPFEVPTDSSFLDKVDYCNRILSEIDAISAVTANEEGEVFCKNIYSSCFLAISHLADELETLISAMWEQYKLLHRQQSK